VIWRTFCSVWPGDNYKANNYTPELAMRHLVLLATNQVIKAIWITVIASMISACASSSDKTAGTGLCPQPRDTEYAPAEIASKTNPLAYNTDNLAAGKQLYNGKVKPVACVECHGKYGDGNGVMASMFAPPPRNFTCVKTVAGIPDGQFYWIIKNGSVGTSMPAFDKLTDDQIWQLVMYIRQFAHSKQADAGKQASADSAINHNESSLRIPDHRGQLNG
jgi:mono/diheme cytochrome c family protein